jgi:peptide/nickel transport system ATP-binding protein
MSALLQANEVSRHFSPRLGWSERLARRLGQASEPRTLRAVDGVSLAIERGEVLGLVGESGCGKSTLGRMLAGILPPSTGQVLLDGAPVMSAGAHPKKQSTRVQMVFQDPFASLNPRMKIGDTIAEGPLAHGLVKRAEASAYVARWMNAVGLDPAFASQLPHQFSGGQRQRIAIARALAMQPDLLICDEPVASLDISIQAQIVNLFLQLRRDLGLTMLFISHDLGVVRHLSDRVAIMYLGHLVETGPAAAIYAQPQHPYTRGLLDSIPRLVTDGSSDIPIQSLQGELPSPLAPPSGCHFHQRCPDCQPLCRTTSPTLGGSDAVSATRAVACHFPLSST